MNERIEELAIRVVGPSRLHGGEFALFGNKDVEKFAKLIIEECMRMCEVTEMSFVTHDCDVEASGAITVKHFIAEHFGVE
jgi:hypothetical protein